MVDIGVLYTEDCGREQLDRYGQMPSVEMCLLTWRSECSLQLPETGRYVINTVSVIVPYKEPGINIREAQKLTRSDQTMVFSAC